MDPLRIERLPSLDRPALLAAFSGWSDAGAAATTAVQYVAERSGARGFARIDAEEFLDFTVQRPIVRLDEQKIRSLEWPGWEFLAVDSGQLVFLVGPEPHFRWRTFCETVLRVVRELGVSRVALLGAFLADVPYTDPVPLTGFASDLALLERLHVPVTPYQGPTGIVGTLADALRRESVPFLSLWAAVPHYVAATTNPRGALALLLKLREWLPLPVDLGPLESAAVTFQAKLHEVLETKTELARALHPPKKSETSH
jgi:predicted ATP-grasp superfamily ATP-dependent carboligase